MEGPSEPLQDEAVQEVNRPFSAATNEGPGSSSDGRQSNLELIIEDPAVKDSIGERGGSHSGSDSLSEEDSGDEVLIKMNQRQKTFDSITRSMERSCEKWKRLHEFVSQVNVDDDSETMLIDSRIDEVKSMCVNLVRPDYILDSLNPSVKEYAVSLIPISRPQFESQHRQLWTALDLLRFGGRMAHIFSLLGRSHLKYPWWEAADRRRSLSQASRVTKATKYSINKVLRLSLTTHPKYRSKAAIQQVVWFNKATGAFRDLFPTEMEKELARLISYEMYDEGRVIRCQGDIPQKLYYILAGKIEMVKVYRLPHGEVHKTVGFLGHKQMSDVEAFEGGQESPTYLVARGRLEVLSLHKEDYGALSSQTDLEAIRSFLVQISIFKDLPVNPAAVGAQLLRIQYFKHENVITSDSLRATYLYVVKSVIMAYGAWPESLSVQGSVAVARRQAVLDDSTGALLRSKDPFSLGCRRDGKHATDMLGLPKRQRNFKMTQLQNTHSLDMPPQDKRKITFVKPHTMIGSFDVNNDKVDKDDEDKDYTKDQGPKVKDPIVRSHTLFNMKTSRDLVGTEEHRKITEVLSVGSVMKRQGRQTYVKLDSLKPLEIFGLDSLEDSSSPADSRFVLISEGAEVLLVNKRYFLDSVNNNTLLEIRKLVKSYASEEEASLLIDEDKRWQAYKKILMQRMISLHC